MKRRAARRQQQHVDLSAPSALYTELVAKNETTWLRDFGASFKGRINYNRSDFCK